MLKNQDVIFYGVDIDKNSIEWCLNSINKIIFSQSSFVPPLAFSDDTFDVIYHYSVFTHVKPEHQLLWLNEFHRLLKPGGLLIGSTHGDRYRKILLKKESEIYNGDKIVMRAG